MGGVGLHTVDDEHAQEKHHRLKGLKVQRHRLPKDPAEDDQERRDQQRDLP